MYSAWMMHIVHISLCKPNACHNFVLTTWKWKWNKSVFNILRQLTYLLTRALLLSACCAAIDWYFMAAGVTGLIGLLARASRCNHAYSPIYIFLLCCVLSLVFLCVCCDACKCRRPWHFTWFYQVSKSVPSRAHSSKPAACGGRTGQTVDGRTTVA